MAVAAQQFQAKACTDMIVSPVMIPGRAAQVAVAAQQFQAKACMDVEFGLYCATQPTVAASTGLRFSCWMGAYPGLAAHFRSAGLNPGNNHWDKARASRISVCSVCIRTLLSSCLASHNSRGTPVTRHAPHWTFCGDRCNRASLMSCLASWWLSAV